MKILCPFCGGSIWGEGWDPKTGRHFYSHVRSQPTQDCAWELAVDEQGKWKKSGTT
jgi:hypothetical protein